MSTSAVSRIATVVLGEALVDVVHRADGSVARLPGGSGANTALALSRLGCATTFATCLGSDDDGRMILDRLRDSGVDLVVEPAQRTSTAEAHLRVDGSADYTFDVSWQPPVELPVAPDHLHVGSFSVVLEPGAGTVHRLASLLRGRATVSYDVNMRPTMTGTSEAVAHRVEAMIGLADVVKLSDEDLDHLWPGVSIADAAAAMIETGRTAVVVTRGADGASWFGASGQVDVAAASGPVVDTIGAGDTFAAAMIAALAEREALGSGGRERLGALVATDWREVLEAAARAAAVTVSREGADPPYAADFHA